MERSSDCRHNFNFTVDVINIVVVPINAYVESICYTNPSKLYTNMMSLKYFLGLIIIFIGIETCLTEDCSTNNIFLIVDIHKMQNYNGIFLSSSASYQSTFKWTIFIQKLSRHLSRENISFITVSFDKLNETMTFYRGRIGRPMIIVFLDTMKDIIQFEILSKKMDMNYPIWLVIFTNMTEDPSCKYCITPDTNNFTLNMNVEMLVYCCCNSNGRIDEWWSLDGIHTKTTYFGYWTLQTGLVYPNNNNNNYMYRNDLNGRNLRIMYIKGSSSFIVKKEAALTGFLGDVFTELSYVMNFTIMPLVIEHHNIVNVFAYDKADIGATGLDMSTAINEEMDFSLPLMITTYRLYFKDRSTSHIQWLAYFQIFQVEIWIALSILIILSVVILTIVKYNAFTYSIVFLIFENSLSVWGLYCQQGLSDIPSYTASKITYFSICLSAVVTSASYSAAYISSLTVKIPNLPFNTLHEFAQDKSYNLIVCKDSADYKYFSDTEDPMLRKALTKMRPKNTLPVTIQDGLEQACTQKVVFFVAEMRKAAITTEPSCKLTSIDTGVIAPISLIINKKNHYINQINYNIRKFLNNGVLQRLKAKYSHNTNFQKRKPKLSVVTLRQITPALVFVAISIIIAVLCLLIEMLYFFYKNYHLDKSHNLINPQTIQFQKSLATHRMKPKHRRHLMIKFK